MDSFCPSRPAKLEDMKYPENTHPHFTEFQLKTGICPLIVATRLLEQLKNYLWAELPDDLADEVAQKAEIVFVGNPHWRKKFQGRYGFAWLEAFMRHWLTGALSRRGSPWVQELPDDYKFGKPLPPVSLAWQKEREARYAVQQARANNLGRQKPQRTAKSRPVRLLAHGSELLAV
jgi:hypothetical protein